MKNYFIIILLTSNIFIQAKTYKACMNKESLEQTQLSTSALIFTQKIYQLAKINYKVINMPSSRCLKAVKSGDVDIMLLATDKVAHSIKKQIKDVSIIKYPFVEKMTIISMDKSIQEIKDFKMFNELGHKCINLRGTEIVRHYLSDKNIINVNSFSQIPKMIKRGRAKYGVIGLSKLEEIKSSFNAPLFHGPKEMPTIELYQIIGQKVSATIAPKIQEAIKGPKSLNLIENSTDLSIAVKM